MPFEGNAFCIDGFVGFEVVEGSAGTPAPGPQRAPGIGLAILPFVDQPNDAGTEARAVVGLDGARGDDGVTPAPGQDLLLPRRAGWSGPGPRPASTASGDTAGRKYEPEFHDDRHRAFGISGSRQIEEYLDFYVRV